MTRKKFQCKDCGYYWEKNPAEKFPLKCPVCSNSRIYQSTRHKRFAKKSSINVRRSYTIRTGSRV